MHNPSVLFSAYIYAYKYIQCTHVGLLQMQLQMSVVSLSEILIGGLLSGNTVSAVGLLNIIHTYVYIYIYTSGASIRFEI